FDTQGQWRDVDQQNVFPVTSQHAGLNGSTNGHNLIRVDTLIGFFATGKFFDQFGDGWHTGRTTDEYDVVDVGNRDAGFLDDVFEWATGALQQVRGHVLKLGARQVLIQVDRTVFGHREVLQRNIGRGSRGEFLLGLFGGFLQTLQRNFIL